MSPVLDSVRDVETSPEENASPGGKITCKADGNPDPSFEWQSKEDDGDGEWMDIPDETSEEIDGFLNNGTSSQIRCIAKNIVKSKEHEETSREIFFEFPFENNHCLRTWFFIHKYKLNQDIIIESKLAQKYK